MARPYLHAHSSHPEERKTKYMSSFQRNLEPSILIKAIFVPTNIRRTKVPHLDNFGAFYYLLVVRDRWGTCTSRNNIGPLWGNQVPEPRGEGINGNKSYSLSKNISLESMAQHHSCHVSTRATLHDTAPYFHVRASSQQDRVSICRAAVDAMDAVR